MSFSGRATPGMLGGQPAQSSQPAGPLLWKGDFETGNLSQFGNIEGAPGSITVTTLDPRAGSHCVRFFTQDSDITAPLQPPYTHINRVHPAAALIPADTLHLFPEGSDRYIAFSVKVPFEQPHAPGGVFPAWAGGAGAFFQLFEVMGPPFAASPPFQLEVQQLPGHNYNSFIIQQNGTYRFAIIWSTRLEYDIWHDFVLRVGFSQDPAQGFLELWLDGNPQMFGNQRARIYFSTIDGSDYLNPRFYIDQYRALHPPGIGIETFADECRVGSSLEAVMLSQRGR